MTSNTSSQRRMTDEELDKFLETFWEDIDNTHEDSDSVVIEEEVK